MQKRILVSIVLLGGTMLTGLTGCKNNAERTAFGGGLLGAGIGAATGGGSGAVAGGLIGAGGGYLIGNAEDKKANSSASLAEENAQLRRELELRRENARLRQALRTN
ncbi:MAG: glycine zipper domain-containing protein [Phycisphaerales bacterium]|nr:glycine zipper domain-containing protein [Phycisphaerales bacterium]